MSDEFERLSNVLGAKEAARVLEARRLDREAMGDPGISPAQLREKVEALEHKFADLENGLGGSIDAALKRIEELERRPLADGGKLDHETSPPSAEGCDRCRGKSVGYCFPPPWAKDKP